MMLFIILIDFLIPLLFQLTSPNHQTLFNIFPSPLSIIPESYPISPLSSPLLLPRMVTPCPAPTPEQSLTSPLP